MIFVNLKFKINYLTQNMNERMNDLRIFVNISWSSGQY
jgi:hypothetical protein